MLTFFILHDILKRRKELRMLAIRRAEVKFVADHVRPGMMLSIFTGRSEVIGETVKERVDATDGAGACQIRFISGTSLIPGDEDRWHYCPEGGGTAQVTGLELTIL